MSDEPLYCVVCGKEDCSEHSYESIGPYCHTCGVIPAPGGACMFHMPGGNRRGCVAAPRSFPVTDDHLDAPDGAFVDGYRRVCDRWERYT